jgi:hypothetical protein
MVMCVGPATRVALRHPDWLASKIIAATNTPKEAAAIGKATTRAAFKACTHIFVVPQS